MGFGSDPAADGVIVRAVQELFRIRSTIPSGPDSVTVNMSYLEVYNDSVIDLLSDDPSTGKLNVLYSAEGVVVQNLESHVVSNPTDVMERMKSASKKRVTEPTNKNVFSSRSHAVCTFSVTIAPKEFDLTSNSDLTQAKLTLVDLAGSEGSDETGFSWRRTNEAKMINGSLLSLGNVIKALVRNDGSHIPYRECKLTRILEDSLGGNSNTIMIACISPAKTNANQTISTLRFAEKARNVENQVKRNVFDRGFSTAEVKKKRAEKSDKLDLPEALKKLDCAQRLIIKLLEHAQNIAHDNGEPKKLVHTLLAAKGQCELIDDIMKHELMSEYKHSSDHFQNIDKAVDASFHNLCDAFNLGTTRSSLGSDDTVFSDTDNRDEEDNPKNRKRDLNLEGNEDKDKEVSDEVQEPNVGQELEIREQLSCDESVESVNGHTKTSSRKKTSTKGRKKRPFQGYKTTRNCNNDDVGLAVDDCFTDNIEDDNNGDSIPSSPNSEDTFKSMCQTSAAKLKDMADRLQGSDLSASNTDSYILLQFHLTKCLGQKPDFNRILDIAQSFLELYTTLSKIERYKLGKQKTNFIDIVSGSSTLGSIAGSADEANTADEHAQSSEVEAFLARVDNAISSIPVDDALQAMQPKRTLANFKTFDRTTRFAIGNLSHLCLAIETFRALTLHDVLSGLTPLSALSPDLSTSLLEKAASLAVRIHPDSSHLDLQDELAIESWAQQISVLEYAEKYLIPALNSEVYDILNQACEVACVLKKYSTETKGKARFDSITSAFRKAQQVKLGEGACDTTLVDYCAGKGNRFCRRRKQITLIFYDLIMRRRIVSRLPDHLFSFEHEFIGYKCFNSARIFSDKDIFDHDFFRPDSNIDCIVKEIENQFLKQMVTLQRYEGQRIIVIESKAQVDAIHHLIDFKSEGKDALPPVSANDREESEENSNEESSNDDSMSDRGLSDYGEPYIHQSS